MATQNSTRQRLIESALKLFTSLGVTETTTKAVAELAQVNEVTLFRHFGNKQGLLLAVLEESTAFSQPGELLQIPSSVSSLGEAVTNYANSYLSAIAQAPELLLSVIGEARHYSPQNRQALGKGISEANSYVAKYLAVETSPLAPEKLASMLNTALLGYAVIENTCTEQQLWGDRSEFIDNLVILLKAETTEIVINDLPASLVHEIMHRAKKEQLRDYALMYVLFGSGLSKEEIASLEKSHQINETTRHLLQVNSRQVPVNQWIMGKRYGSYTRNPLTGWLRSRTGEHPALFLNDAGLPMTAVDIDLRWQELTEGLLTPEGRSPIIEQAAQTWCVEMLSKGITLENLSMLTGLHLSKLQPYARRVKEKLALEQAISLDRKS
ncbi:MAG: TetR family transcriptional regulator [Chroococcus sp. CMT-3BRIN-NPC107]|jgi:AcrR family transcriptional regulator|nr:TetR family transcriptional regulator [Chroococcus sp. CMT-3BRIN-NPC107]